MRHTLVGWAYRGQLRCTTPLRSASTEEPQVQNPRRRGGYERYNSHWCGAVRLRGRASGIEPGVATNRRGPRSRKLVDTTTTGCACERHLPSFRHNPCNNDSPRLGHFRTSALIQAEIAQYGSITSSFVAPAGTNAVPRVDVVSSLAQELKRGPDPRLWRQAVSRRKTPAITGVR